MRYRMIGIDLDGTLLDSAGRLSDENRRAVHAAHEAGLRVVPCTGRSWRESRRVLRSLPDLELGVFVTGALICEVATGRTVHHQPLELELVHGLVELLRDEPDAVLVFREPGRAGHEYLVTGNGELTANTRWWFEQNELLIHEQVQLKADDLHHSVRVGMVASTERMPQLHRRIEQRFADRVTFHSFQAVPRPRDQASWEVLEIFAAGVDKWNGIEWVAAQHGIERDQIVVIGDQINDVPMFGVAGLSIAMANAIEPVKAAADRQTASNDEHGVARAIDNLLTGAW